MTLGIAVWGEFEVEGLSDDFTGLRMKIEIKIDEIDFDVLEQVLVNCQAPFEVRAIDYGSTARPFADFHGNEIPA
jgi:hypothetical protein